MLFQKSRQNLPFAITENNFDNCFWISKLLTDIKDLSNRESSICKCDTSYSLQKISESCVKINIEIIPRESVFSGTVFKMKSYVTKAFPFQPIQIFSEKVIFHPNIDFKTREVILPIFSMWSANTSLYIILLSLEFMTIEPNLEFLPKNKENQDCAYLFHSNIPKFLHKLKKFEEYIESEEIEDELTDDTKTLFLEEKDKNNWEEENYTSENFKKRKLDDCFLECQFSLKRFKIE